MFRKQILESAQSQTLGTILLARPLGGWVLAIMGVFVVVVCVGIITSVHYTRKFVSSGVLYPSTGVAKIVSPESGVVENVAVSDGDIVQDGSG